MSDGARARHDPAQSWPPAPGQATPGRSGYKDLKGQARKGGTDLRSVQCGQGDNLAKSLPKASRGHVGSPGTVYCDSPAGGSLGLASCRKGHKL